MNDLHALFHEYNPWWGNGFTTGALIPRPLVHNQLIKHIETPEVVMLTGLRRVGKTVSMKQLIKCLLEEREVAARNIFYISMDDYQLSGMSIMEIVGEYRKIM